MEKYSYTTYDELKILGTKMPMDFLTLPAAGSLPIHSLAVLRKHLSNLWLIEPIKHEKQINTCLKERKIIYDPKGGIQQHL